MFPPDRWWPSGLDVWNRKIHSFEARIYRLFWGKQHGDDTRLATTPDLNRPCAFFCHSKFLSHVYIILEPMCHAFSTTLTLQAFHNKMAIDTIVAFDATNRMEAEARWCINQLLIRSVRSIMFVFKLGLVQLLKPGKSLSVLLTILKGRSQFPLVLLLSKLQSISPN